MVLWTTLNSRRDIRLARILSAPANHWINLAAIWFAAAAALAPNAIVAVTVHRWH